MSTATVPTAAALESQLRDLGYQPGRPPTYAPMSAAVDRSTARRMRCRSCRRRGLGCKHFHKEAAVRCVAVCVCGAGEEI